MKYIVLIPAYEPDDNLIILLKTIPQDMDIVIVNDGSDSQYDIVFKEARKYAHIITYKHNMGKGYALKEGIKYLKDKYHDYVVVTVDADGQHTIKDAIKLCDYAKEHKDTLVLGRRTWNNTMPIRSRVGNTITRLVFHLKTGLRIYDTQTGLRAFSSELSDYVLNISGNRYEYEMNMLLDLKQNHIKYHEIKIKTIYFNNNKNSHFDSIKDSYIIYRDIFKHKKTR